MALFYNRAVGIFLMMIPFVLDLLGMASAQLSANFYSTSCPNALSTIRTTVNSAVSADPRMGASLLRLHFHDCFVNGCDASVLLDDTANSAGEKSAGPNANSLRGFEVIDNIKTRVENLCPGVVSCADILAVAARDSVVALRGPSWNVLLGRRDSLTAASSGAVVSNIPRPILNLNALISSFSNKGLNARDMVALSGAHTIGQAQCSSFRTRLYNDVNINTTFAASLIPRCPRTGGDRLLSPLDATPTNFDNAYFTNLRSQRGLLHSDQELFNGGSTDAQVTTYSTNSNAFFTDFGNAMIKMGNISPLTGTNGQIRTNCRRRN